MSAKGKGPYKKAFAVGSTRVAATMTPSLLNADTWWTRFLHGTSLGRYLITHYGVLWNKRFSKKLMASRSSLLTPRKPNLHFKMFAEELDLKHFIVSLVLVFLCLRP